MKYSKQDRFLWQDRKRTYTRETERQRRRRRIQEQIAFLTRRKR